jgi:hypothetical protein
MPGARTRRLVLAATFLWRNIGWWRCRSSDCRRASVARTGCGCLLEYSRRADLGVGLVAYPIEGIGTALLTIVARVASASNYLDGNRRRRTVLPLYCAVGLSIVGLLLTVKAAPIMLSLAEPRSATAIQRAFDEFFVWGLYLRGTADTLAFAALVWALSDLHRAV